MPGRSNQWRAAALALALFLCGCAGTPWRQAQYARPFDFPTDTFAFANELVWEYSWDATGGRTVRRRYPPAEYSHHCFVLARAARQFFQHARFAPDLPPATDDHYRRIIGEVMARSPRRATPDPQRIVVAGFANLRQFSAAKEPLLKRACGGAHQSYLQRGHWRIMVPFDRDHQQRIAHQLLRGLRRHRPPIAHVIRFPALSINHAVVFFACREGMDSLDFSAYDPNSPEAPILIRFHYPTRTFHYPQTKYFRGGPVDVYEVYSNWNY